MMYGKAALVIACLLCSPSVFSQTAKKTIGPRFLELRIRIIPSKDTYVLREKVLTRTEFTNLTGRTLCFPEPALTQEVDGSGYVVTEGQGPVSDERFIEHFSGGLTWPREKLLAEIEERWIKLAPNAEYVTKSSAVKFCLTENGQWVLRSTYHPPDCSYNLTECREYFWSTVESSGCTLPKAVVSAEPISVNVVPPPDAK